VLVDLRNEMSALPACPQCKSELTYQGIRLVEGDHNIDCRIEGFGGMKLKSEFVRKA
jgi:protein PhnA